MRKKSKKKMTVQEAGQKGGRRTLERYGLDYFKTIAKKPRKRDKHE